MLYSGNSFMDITLQKPFTDFRALIVNFTNAGFVNGFIYPTQFLQSIIGKENYQLGSSITTLSNSYYVNYKVKSTTEIICGAMHIENCHILSIYGIK